MSHATQAWAEYIAWLDALIGYSAKELERLRESVCRYVLDKLESREFDLPKHKSEPTGAGLRASCSVF